MDGNKRVVLAADQVALNCGIRIGMAVTKAQVLVPEILIKDSEQDADHEGLERLALWALQRFAPVAAADPPDGIIIDVTGAAHLYGGETEMLSAMIDGLAASGVTAKAAIADTWGAAHALARFSSGAITIAPAGETRLAICKLPLIALRLPVKTVDGLRGMGFRTIGDLMDQPRPPIALRFGSEPGRRVDQALGVQREPIEPVRMPDVPQVRRGFAEPIGAAETIARYIGILVSQLCEKLEDKGEGVKRLDLLFHRVDNRIEAVRIGTAKPVRDPKRLTRLLCGKIETVDPGFGIELMVLSATLTESLIPKQIATSFIEEPEADVSELIDTLANAYGAERLYRIAPVASDVPERSFKRVPAMAPADGTVWPSKWPRPARIFKPERIETMALMPDYPPVSFTWRGERRRVKLADGPERIFGEWWKRDAEISAVRDYFRVEDEGGNRYWIFRAGDGEDTATGSHQWYMQGIFG